jgi:predicted nucleic acid-binding Zn ribbon protein
VRERQRKRMAMVAMLVVLAMLAAFAIGSLAGHGR